MKIFDNVTNIVRDDMEKTIKRNSKVSVAAACFSMYAYSDLASITKLGKNENVNTEIIEKICVALDCDVSDIMEMTNEEAK